MNKALAVGKKEFRQILRDRRTLMILLFIPVFFLLLFGYALNFDIRHVALAVQDRDQSTESRALVNAFVNSGYFDLAASFHSDAELQRLMDANTIRAALVIPENTGRALAARRSRTGAGADQRRQREHRRHRARLLDDDRPGRLEPTCSSSSAAPAPRRRFSSSRGSGSTPSCGARSSSSRASSASSA